MDIQTIDNLIDELEQSETSLSNIRNLSALYNVKKHFTEHGIEDSRTTKELADVIPSYLQYINIKRKYQMHEISQEAVFMATQAICKEILEFIHALYSGTDTQTERDIIYAMIKEMQ